MKDLYIFTELHIKTNMVKVFISVGRYNNIQCLPLNKITLNQQKSDNNNRMIQLTDVFLCTVKV